MTLCADFVIDTVVRSIKMINSFDANCEEAGYTCTGEAWEILNQLRINLKNVLRELAEDV